MASGLMMSNFLSLFVLYLILIYIRLGSAVSRKAFLAFRISEKQLFVFRLEQFVRNPWHIVAALTPFGIFLSDHLTIQSRLLLVGQLYLSLIFTILITYSAWDYLNLRGWENHFIGLYILPLSGITFLPKLNQEFWLILNPFGGWTLTPVLLTEWLGIPAIASLPIGALFLPLILYFQKQIFANRYY